MTFDYDYLFNLRISHLAPLLPGGQMQVNPPIPSWQVAPPWHGCGEHSFTLILQSGPENPWAQLHRNHPAPDSQVPPLWHGCPWHWSTGSVQNDPPQPAVHRHCDFPDPDNVIQVPPFMHWPVRHCVAISLQVVPVSTNTKIKGREEKAVQELHHCLESRKCDIPSYTQVLSDLN